MLDDILQRAHGQIGPCGMVILLVLVVGWLVPVYAADSQEPFQSLEKRLIEDGFDSTRIQTIFANTDVSFEKSGVSAYFMHKESKLNYKQFTRVWNVSSAKNYMKEHQYYLLVVI